ncbi:flagellar protein [Aceticella autotrophica]|uniref:Flagellar protein n=1 Tax=Aceticella autotrophica TaxID=2755338 RepID=A0A974Y463_9THEO|nr:TIGR02530 family flagellar biosynthesis protein [Aceticella autotrophica]QSZ26605.1 flagellar protein [Aceticella autotrophica]
MDKINLTGYVYVNGISNKTSSVKNNKFEDIFSKKKEELKFSKHAIERISMRNLNVSEIEYNKLIEAVNKAESKGIRNTLILIDRKAFVVNLKNRTVITAIDGQALKNNVITNIDGAVII